jgi:hypothetical protein
VFPEQAGLSFAVSLNLQNVDELHLSAPGFWVEWFPSELQSALVVSCIDIWALRPAVGGGPGS